MFTGYKKRGIRIREGQIWTVGNATIKGGGKVILTKVMGTQGLFSSKNVENDELLFVGVQNLGKLVKDTEKIKEGE